MSPDRSAALARLPPPGCQVSLSCPLHFAVQSEAQLTQGWPQRRPPKGSPQMVLGIFLRRLLEATQQVAQLAWREADGVDVGVWWQDGRVVSAPEYNGHQAVH
ncbi:hypothetical protein E2C01_029756 [Portunus trituberculatus]|uniref:Uncharacterized protein n=1 Tax=Portunus trituberculatus TaxID=210409 RepID=A0A5B7EQ62_PORTR|nr:hypothetical protein [Portunus trituberculatus]